MLDRLIDIICNSDDPRARGKAVMLLGDMGDEAPPEAIAVVMDALQTDPDLNVQRNAAVALYRFGPKAWAAVPKLVRALEVDDGILSGIAIAALAEIGHPTPACVEALCQILLNHGKEGLRMAAARALGELRSAVLELTEALSDESPNVVLEVVTSLAQIGPEARLAVPGLRTAGRRYGGGIQLCVEMTLGHIVAPFVSCN